MSRPPLTYSRAPERAAAADRWQRQPRISEARFQALFDHAPIGQVFSGLDGTITDVNDALATMLGYPAERMIGHRALEFVAPDDRDAARRDAADLLEGRATSVSSPRRFVHHDGHEVPVRIVSVMLPAAEGASRRWASMVVDLSGEEGSRAQLEQAHTAAVRSMDRLHLLHSIATAANDAHTLDDLVPRVLRTVCSRLDLPGAALVRWDGTAPHVVHGIGVIGCVAGLEPPAGDEPAVVATPNGSLLLAPLAGTGPHRMALAFAASAAQFDERHREVLSIIGNECSRVIEREAAEERLRESVRWFQVVFDDSPLAMGLTLGDTGTYSAVNEALCHLVGRPREQLIGASARDIVHPEDVALLDPAGARAANAPDGRYRFEVRIRHSSGATVIAAITLAWLRGPDGARLLLAQMEDVTARRRAEDALREQAERDALTGLANRAYLTGRMEQLGAAGASCAVLFVDVDGFKLVNDTRGHEVGDEVLVEVARRLRTVVRPTDLIARFGGDEFVVVCGANGSVVPSEPDAFARRVAARIGNALTAPIETRAGSANVTASIGISGGRVSPEEPQSLLRQADAAMYQAKRLGKDRYAVYDAKLHERTVEFQHTAAALRNALDEDRLVVHYQPIVDLADARIVGFEALVRLLDEDGEIVPPARFVNVAELSGSIVPIGTWVLRESCRTVARIAERAGRRLDVSVNVAAQQAARADFADTVSHALADAGLPAGALTLELTESALLEAGDTTLQQLKGLRERGVYIGLDDFGTGYSSLTYLRQLPVTHLKVDRSFVADMVTDASNAAIVRAVTGLASELGLFWIAEGVETEQQWQALRAIGPGYAQGYLFSRPLPAGTLEHVLRLRDDDSSCRRAAGL